jgi:LuxR family transcriptional regulator, transcriptional regulator of spore coat protein
MKLTRREMEVLKLIGSELTTEQIANNLHLSVPTIETHRRNLFRKVGVQSAVGLVKVAILNNWIKIEPPKTIKP